MKSEVWVYPGQSGNWHFVSVAKKISEMLKKKFGERARGWGSLPVTATIGKTSWQTSIFPDKREGVYLLPLKASVRKKEGIFSGDKVPLSITIRL